MIKKNKRMVALLMLALLGWFMIGYVVSLTVYLQMYGGGQGLEQFRIFIAEPSRAISVLLLGDETAVGKRIHDLFLGGWQWVYWGIVLALLALTYFRRKRVIKKEASDYGSHGTARWATKREIMRRFTGDEKGIILGKFKGKTLIHPIKSPLNQFVITFGGAGSGKSTGLVIPNILHTSKHLGESIVVTDTKGELYNATAATLRARGYEVWTLNLLDPRRSMRYNPMDYVFESKDAASLATTIIRNTTNPNAKDAGDFWERAEHALLNTLILYVKEVCPPEEQHLTSVLEVGLSIGDNPE